MSVGQELISSIGNGLLIFLGVCSADRDAEAEYISDKLLNLRIFSDSRGKFDHSALDESADILVVSQFTLYGDTRKGRRPSFVNAATPELADDLYQIFNKTMMDLGLRVKTGVLGAHMQVEIHNDGPVTLLVENPN